MGKCRKCGCEWFLPNPVSAAQKFFSGGSVGVKAQVPGVEVHAQVQGMPAQDNKSDQVAYLNCTCGHHYNYH